MNFAELISMTGNLGSTLGGAVSIVHIGKLLYNNGMRKLLSFQFLQLFSTALVFIGISFILWSNSLGFEKTGPVGPAGEQGPPGIQGAPGKDLILTPEFSALEDAMRCQLKISYYGRRVAMINNLNNQNVMYQNGQMAEMRNTIRYHNFNTSGPTPADTIKKMVQVDFGRDFSFGTHPNFDLNHLTPAPGQEDIKDDPVKQEDYRRLYDTFQQDGRLIREIKSLYDDAISRCNDEIDSLVSPTKN